MLFFKSVLLVPVAFTLASALSLGLKEEDTAITSTQPLSFADAAANASTCEKEDLDDCNSFCAASQSEAKCLASGQKVTCYCKPGKSSGSCEEKCLFCFPSQASFLEASREYLFGATPQTEQTTLD